jgi:hypothetical protein
LRKTLANNHRLEGLKRELDLVEHPKSMTNQALSVHYGRNLDVFFDLLLYCLFDATSRAPFHIIWRLHSAYVLATLSIFSILCLMLLLALLKRRLMPLLELVLVLKSPIEHVGQRNVVVEIYLFCPFQEKIRCIEMA